MFKGRIHRVTIIVLLLMMVGGMKGYAADPSTPQSSYTTLTGSYNSSIGPGVKVCPSLDSNKDGSLEVSSTSVFRVSANIDDYGDPSANTFEWVVYGGWITSFNGNSVSGTYTSQHTTYANGYIRYSYYSGTGSVDVSSEMQSYITVEWDTTNFSVVYGWVAVRQTSSYGCSDGVWSVFTNDIRNYPPDVTCPADIRVPYSYISSGLLRLTLPTVSDDNCNGTLSYSYTVQNPVGTQIDSGTDSDLSATVKLGSNLVTWTVSDGSRSTTCQCYVIVEPDLDILHVAWINPSCELSNGSLLVTDTTQYNFYSPIEFSLDGGTYSRVVSYTGLDAGTHTLQARVVYGDNNGDGSSDVQYSDIYTITLHDMAASSVDDVPAEGTYVTVTDASCYTAEDGSISVTETAMDPQNNSISFDGDDYLLTNRVLSNQTLTQFSVATWIKVPSSVTSTGTLLSFDYLKYFELGLSVTGSNLSVLFRTLNFSYAPSTAVVNDGKWHLIVLVFDKGNRTVYVDNNVSTSYDSRYTSVGGASVGSCYGMIGVRSTTTSFSSPTFATSPNYYTGEMAEMAVYYNTALTSADVSSILKNGISSLTTQPDDHWVFNDIPSNVSPDNYNVFTDAGNLTSENYWARYTNCALTSGTDAPVLYSYTDTSSVTDDDDFSPTSADISGLGVGQYTLHVKDIFGCGEATGTYDVGNSDTNAPEMFWNAALKKTATQSSNYSGANYASLAVDGLFSTASETNNSTGAYWQVDLGGIYSIRMVNIYPNSSLSDFYVLFSSTGFTGGSTLGTDTTSLGSSRYYHFSGTTSGDKDSIIFTVNARYVRIRLKGTGAVSLKEVEVLCDNTPPAVRKFYLDSALNSCSYTIVSDDASIAPEAYDACKGITSLEHNASYTSDTSLVGYELGLGDEDITWTATDDIPMSTQITLTYRVLDTIPPYFNPLPFAYQHDTITYCESQSYKFAIPNAYDNYVGCPDTSTGVATNLTSLTLYSDNIYLGYSYSSMSSYAPVANDSTGYIDPEDCLPAGDRVLEWRVVDYVGNETTDRLYLHVQKQPRVLSVFSADRTCHGVDDAQVVFAEIESEQDVISTTNVTYILRKATSPYNDVYTQINDNSFDGVDPGTYRALISVDGCESNYVEVAVLDPDPIEVTTIETKVRCAGQSNGALIVNVTGGSTTDILHLMGGSTIAASASNYGALNLTTTGTIEGWFYLDTLGTASGTTNYNTNLFGVYNGATACYGIKIANGVLTFYVGTNSVAYTGTINERTWYYVAGTWNSSGLSVSVDNGTPNTSSVSNPTAPTGGTVYFGSFNTGATTTNLWGFVRAVRIWNTVVSSSDLVTNLYLLYPVDTGDNLVANYPIAAGGGTILQNLVPGGNAGTVTSSNYAWQKFAYYWTNSDNGFVSRLTSLSNVPADTFHLLLSDPLGCTFDTALVVGLYDDTAPVMTFYSDGQGGTKLSEGDPIVRYTDGTNAYAANLSGDCYYFPVLLEFDPKVDDGECPADSVVLTHVLVSGQYGVDPPLSYSLDSTGMYDQIRIRWTATDKGGNYSTQLVDYYIIDDEAPVLSWVDQTRYADTAVCEYTVTAADSLLGLTYVENCNTGRLYNNINNTSSLAGATFSVGTTTVRWIYKDKAITGYSTSGQADTVIVTLTVEDNQAPTADCGSPFTVSLDEYGSSIIDYSDVLGPDAEDNCSISRYALTKNIAYGLTTATQSSYSNGSCFASNSANAAAALDGNTSSVVADCSSSSTTATELTPSWWQVDLGAADTIYAVRVYNSAAATLNNFWVVVSTSASPSYSGSLSSSSPGFSSDVVDSIHYTSGAVSGSQLLAFSHPVVGQYVRIWMDQAATQLSLAEVEVYGSNDPESSLDVDCDDVRYTPNASYSVQGTFSPIGVLLTIIDGGENTSSCLTDVTVKDLTAPSVATPSTISISIEADGDVNLNDSIYLSRISSGTSDACGIDSVWVNPYLFDCGYSGAQQTVYLYAQDVNGNRSRQTAHINIVDTIPPVITVKSNIKLYLGSDGYYVIDPESDIVATASDNCSDSVNLVYECTPDTVYCSDQGYIDFKLVVIDAYGNKDSIILTASEETVEVVDNLPPTASYNSYTVVIPPSGDTVLYFSNIIPDENIRDNCDEYGLGDKWISYDEGASWCLVPNEGSGTTSAFVNMASQAAVTASSTSYSSSYLLSNVKDNSTGTSYITSAYTGSRYVTYGFDTLYQFNETQVYWATATFVSSNWILQNTAYNGTVLLPQANITAYSAARNNNYIYNCADGTNNYYQSTATNTTSNDSCWVRYEFSQTMYITAARVYWRNSPTNTYGPYLEYSNDGSNWTRYATAFGRTTGGYNNLNSLSITAKYFRVVFDMGSGTRAEVTEFQLYGSPANTYNCSLPTSAYVQYYNHTTNAWTTVCSSIGTTASQYNTCTFSSTITTDSLRLYFNGSSNYYIGVAEWAVYGREIPEDDYVACISYDCEDVGEDVPIYLLVEDAAHNTDTIIAHVDIVPYFSISSVKIRDCGINHEAFVYYPDSLVSGRSYTESWSSANTIYCLTYSGSPGYTTSSMESPFLAYNAITTGQYYSGTLTLTDDVTGCSVSYDFTFSYLGGGSGESDATIITDQKVCYKDFATYGAAEIPSGVTSVVWYEWTIPDYWNEGIYTYKAASIDTLTLLTTITYHQATADTVDVHWNYDFRTSSTVNTAVADIHYKRACHDQYQSSGSSYCYDDLTYEVTVYYIDPPYLASTPTDICPYDTVVYSVDPADTALFANYSWTVSSAGRILDGGNTYDDFVTVVWNNTSVLPYIKIVGYNLIGCSDSVIYNSFDFVDTEAPVLSCSGLDRSSNNTFGSCSATFTSLPVPEMTDNCHNRIASYSNDYNGKTSAAGTFPVGVSTITWTATDYMGNSGTCSYTVTVYDAEAPYFDKSPTDTTLTAGSGCQCTFVGIKRDVAATDNCNSTINITGTVYVYNTSTGLYDQVQQTGLTSLDGYVFTADTSRVVWVANDGVDNDINGVYDNEVTTEFYVYVKDKTAPTIATLSDINASNDVGECAATLTITAPTSASLSDNCTDSDDLTVSFVKRDDNLDETDPYPVGTTVITWRVYDEANNKATATQQVIVADTSKPYFDPVDTSFANVSIGYCELDGYSLDIPVPYDNCQVASITWTVVNSGGTVYSATGTITHAQSANFNPNGDWKTEAIPSLPADSVNGSNYTVTWIAVDINGNTSGTYSCTLHVQVKPFIRSVNWTELSCGNANDGTITVYSADVRSESGLSIEYSINNWQSYQVNNSVFTSLKAGTYTVQIRVNGCYSNKVSVTISEKATYTLTITSSTNVYCYEDEDGAIDVTLSGGVDGQLHFQGGTGVSAADYDALDLTTTGTIEAWVYLESLSNAVLVGKGTAYSLELYEGRFTIRVGSAYFSGTGVVPVTKRWYHVTGTWDSSSSSMHIYVDGVDQGGSISGTLAASVPNTSSVQIGNGFYGILRDVRIWNDTSHGAILTSKLIAYSETNLVAYWQLQDGSGNTATNDCTPKNANATLATGASSLWVEDYPQPGFYTWTKNGSSLTSDSIDISGLGIGTYAISFQDPYGCPNPAISASRIIYSTDAEEPEISNEPNDTVYADASCKHIVTAAEMSSLMPTITDECAFDTTWTVKPAATLADTTYNGSNFVGAVLELGVNTITVSTLQNTNVTSSYTYKIIVLDTISPVADGKDGTATLGDDGTISYDAINFNSNSTDNCTSKRNLVYYLSPTGADGSYSDELTFDCSDLGDTVAIYFMACDESGNCSVQYGNQMVVTDSIAPTIGNKSFTLQVCATVDSTETVPAYTTVVSGSLLLDDGNYSDNCSVTKIEYLLDYAGSYSSWSMGVWTLGDDAGDNDFYQGVTYVWFRVTDSSGNVSDPKIVYTVTVLPRPAPGDEIH